MNTLTKLAWASLALAKISGVVGLVLGYSSHRQLGATLLALAFVMIAVVVGLCLVSMRREVAQDESDVQALQRMVQQGTLQAFLSQARSQKQR